MAGLGPVVSTVIVDTSRTSGTPTGAGYLAGLAVIGIGMLAGAGAVALLRRSRGDRKDGGGGYLAIFYVEDT
jgi:hypothetical protein